MNLKHFPACNRAKVRLPLISGETCVPHVAKRRQYFPEDTSMIRSEVVKLAESSNSLVASGVGDQPRSRQEKGWQGGVC